MTREEQKELLKKQIEYSEYYVNKYNTELDSEKLKEFIKSMLCDEWMCRPQKPSNINN